MKSHIAESVDTLVTWLLPVKNGMPYLRETLSSIASQSVGPVAVLAWDNGSTDGSVEELRSWIPERLPGRVVSERPMGLGASLAAMVEEASTPYCARIDADDINHPERLARQIGLLEKNPQMVLCGSNVYHIDADGNDLGDAYTYPSKDREIRWRMRFANTLVHPAVVFRRDAVLAAGNYRDIIPGQDIDLWLRLSLRGRMQNISDRLVYCRRHPNRVAERAGKSGQELHRELIEHYGEKVLPGSSNTVLFRLHHLLVLDLTERVSKADLDMHKTAAERFANALGCPKSYFTESSYFRKQRQNLRSRYLNTLPLVGEARQTLRTLRGIFTGRDPADHS